MDTNTFTTVGNGLTQTSGASINLPFPDINRSFEEISSHRITTLASPPKQLIPLQAGTAGNDFLRGDTTLYGLEGNDVIWGAGRKANVLFGNDGNDQIRGGIKDDVLNGGAGQDRLIGDLGNDSLVGGSGDDNLSGGNRQDRLKGGSGADQLKGDFGNDYLDGGTGLDHLMGGNGNDVLMDYYGGDRLTGGHGADQFGVGSPLANAVTIVTDFKVGTDQVKILRLGADFQDLTFQTSRTGTLVIDQGHAIATLLGIKAARLTADSFLFGDAPLADTLQHNLDQSLASEPAATALSATIFAGDGTLWQGFAGVYDREGQNPIEANALFGAGSITKPIVATTVLQLEQEGKLSLQDTLSQWLPELTQGIPNRDRITIQQLLAHTSGLRNYTDEPELIAALIQDPNSVLSQQYTTEDLLTFIQNKPALADPGTDFFYSNSNYLLLGEIIEKATGSTLASQLQQRIFDPLGMDYTFYQPQAALRKGTLTTTYADFDEDGQLNPLDEKNLSWAAAAGAVISTATDIAKFAQGLFQGELLAPVTLAKMINENSDLGSLGNIESVRYGLGIQSGRITELGDYLNHNGATIGWQSEMVYLPEQQITGTVMASASASLNNEIVAKLVFQNLQNTVQQSPDFSRN